MNYVLSSLCVALATAGALTASEITQDSSTPVAYNAKNKTEKQPVFLICPRADSYSAWSLYVTVERNDPGKILGLGLEELTGKNAKQMSYEAVVAAQRDDKTPRKNLGTLDANQFGKEELRVHENDALRVSLTPEGRDYHLNISMRISLSDRFIIGGKEQNRRDIVLHYDADSQTWSACARKLVSADKRQSVHGECLPLTGIVFPVTGTGIYRVIAAATNGDAIILLDR